MSVIFYEKHGCINNTKQKKKLIAHGLSLDVRNLLKNDWTAEALRPFFADKPIKDWFNPVAPRIKSGEVDPSGFDEQAALEAMIADPYLIRRPLIEYKQFYCSGFDWEQLMQVLPVSHYSELKEDIVTCTQTMSCEEKV